MDLSPSLYLFVCVQFEQENKALYAEMNSMTEDVRSVCRSIRKLSCISRSTSYSSKSEVMHVITFLGGTSDQRKRAWVQMFSHVNLEWTE